MKKKLFLLMLSFSFLVFSCDNEEDPIATDSDSEQVFEDMMYMNAEINSAIGIGLGAITGSGGRLAENDLFCGSFNFSFEPNLLLELDFGDGCTGLDGKTRSGKIIFNTAGEFGQQGFSFTIAFDSFSVDGDQLSGSVTSSGYTLNNNGNYEYSVSAQDLKLTLVENNNTISYSGNHTYEWIEGFGSEDATTNTYSVTGSASGVTRDGVAYDSEIIAPHIVKTACYGSGIYYPVSGKSQITPVGFQQFTVDFGAGNCDKKATIEVGLLTYELSLP